MAGGLGIRQREGEQHHQVPDHIQAVCMLLTPQSSVGVANRSDIEILFCTKQLYTPRQYHYQLPRREEKQSLKKNYCGVGKLIISFNQAQMSLHTNVHAPRTTLSGRIQIGHKSGLFIYFYLLSSCEYKASQASVWPYLLPGVGNERFAAYPILNFILN